MIDLVLHKQSLISLVTTVIPRGNKVQGLWKNLGGANKACYGRCANGGCRVNKTLRSVHFGVVVVEVINCKCGGIVRNQIW